MSQVINNCKHLNTQWVDVTSSVTGEPMRSGYCPDCRQVALVPVQPSLSAREAFEAWARSNGYVVTTALDGEGYSQQGTDRAWDVWQAAISAQRQDSEQSRLMLADDTSPRIPQRLGSDKAEQAAMYQWIRSNVSEDMQWYLFGHVVNSPEDFDKAIRAAIAKGTEP